MTEAERTITTPDAPDGAARSADPSSAAPEAGAETDAAADAGTGPDTGAPAGTSVRAPGAAGVRGRRIAVLIGVAVLAYLLDLLSKIWVVHSLEHHDPIDVFGHYLRFDAIRNAGAAFGLGQGMTIVFTVIAVGVIAVIVRLSRRLYSLPWAVALGLLLGGAFGNLTDRIFRAPGSFQGRVVDFIAPAHFAVFNLADSAICCGGVLIVLLSFRGVDPDGTKHQD
ncbi:signal peptidase II [Actinacidiphila sp. ITFR-21]|uniref:signal peptidase II n=1 Tax=Actinacidiphila sp. ITFR-21 TaxID=3075199 RepID=UPI00288C34B1|nr:signal peptidase II [Streptomyces sp. ITFR-21]WNI15112.1 signal peptidase II [Streptomyces sp. ITFR-21]